MSDYTKKHKTLFKTISMVVVCLFVLNNFAFAIEGTNLSIYSSMDKADFRAKFKAKMVLLAHQAVNKYIKNIISRIKDVRGRDGFFQEPVRLADGRKFNVTFIPGLLSKTGQFAHIGLSRRAIYADSEFYQPHKRDELEAIVMHEMDELSCWEELRDDMLHLDAGEMRQWIKDHAEKPDERLKNTEYEDLTSSQIAKMIHESAYPLDALHEKYAEEADFDFNYINRLLTLYGTDGDSEDVNIAAGGDSEKPKYTPSEQEQLEKWLIEFRKKVIEHFAQYTPKSGSQKKQFVLTQREQKACSEDIEKFKEYFREDDPKRLAKAFFMSALNSYADMLADHRSGPIAYLESDDFTGCMYTDLINEFWDGFCEKHVKEKDRKEKLKESFFGKDARFHSILRGIASGRPLLFIRDENSFGFLENALRMIADMTSGEIFSVPLTPFTDRDQLIGGKMPVGKRHPGQIKQEWTYYENVIPRLIKYAEENPEKPVYLVLDNFDSLHDETRAMLNELIRTKRQIIPELGGEIVLPDNLYFIATMSGKAKIKDEAFFGRFVRKRQADFTFWMTLRTIEATPGLSEKFKDLIVENMPEGERQNEAVRLKVIKNFLDERVREGIKRLTVEEVASTLGLGVPNAMRTAAEGIIAEDYEELKEKMVDTELAPGKASKEALDEIKKYYDALVKKYYDHLKSQGCDTDFWEHPVLSEDFLVVFYVNSPQSPIFISEDFTLLLEELYPEKQLSNNDVIRLFTYIKGRADDYKARGVEHDLRTVAIEELYYIMRDKLSDEGISDRVKSKIRDMLKHRCITVSGASKRDSLYDCELYRKISDDLTEMASKEKDEEKKKLIDEILRNLEKAAECHSEAVVFFEKGDEKTAEAKIKEYAEIMKYFIIPGVEGSGRKFKKFLRMVEDLNVYGDDLTKAVKEHKAWVKRRMHLVEGDYDFSSLQHSYKFNPKKNLFTVEGVSIKVKPSIVDEDSLFEETGLILDKPTLKMLSAIFRAYKYGNRVLVLSGLTGIGKTFTLQAFAKMIDAEFYGEPTHKGSDIDKLAGIVKSDKDGDFYLEDDTKFLEAASKDAKGRDHGYVIALSELNAKVARDGSAALAWWMVPFARGDDPILLTEHPRPPPSDGEIFETLNVNKGCFIGIDINPKEGGYAARGTLPAALSEIVPAINVNESLDKDDVKLFIDTYFKRQAKDSARLSAISVLATKVFTDIQEMINEKIIATKRKDILSKRDLKRFCDDMLKNYSEKEIAGVFKRALYFNFLARFPGEDRRMVRALIDKEVELCKDIRKVTKDGEPIISPLNDVQGDGKGMSADLVVKDSRAFRDEDFETPRDYPFSLSPDENAEIVSEDLDIDELEHILKEHERGVYTVSVLNDGRILTSERGFTIRIWDLKGKKVYKLFKGTQFLSSDVLPDGRAVLGDNTGKVWVWDLENETARVFKIGGSGYVASNVLALPDGRIVAVYHQKGGDTGNAYMYLWDITPGEEKLTEIDNSGLKIKTVARFPDRDNSIIVGYDVKDPMDPAVGVWDLDTKEIIFLKHPGLKGAHAVSGVPDDPNKVVSGHIDGSIWIWDIDKAERTDTVDYRNLQVHDGCVRSLIALEGGKIISGGDDKKVKITQLSDPDAGQMSKTQTMNIHEGAVEFLACDPRDPNRFLSGSSDGTVKIWRAKVSAALKILRGHKQKIYTAAYNPDGTKIVTASDDKTAKIWNAETGVELKTLEGHKSEVRYAAFSPDGKKVMTAGADWNVKIWDAETGEEKRTIECEAGSLCSAAFSPDGKQILAAGIRPNQQGIQIATIRMFNAETGEKIGNPIMQKASHLTAVFSPDGTKIATAGFKEITGGGLIGAAKIWDARTGKELQNLGNTGAAFNSIAFSPDGTKVVTTSEEATLTIWDVETGEELKKLGLEDLETFIAFAAFSPDGTKIVTAGKDKEGTGAVRILDAETLTTKLILKDHRDLVRFASFSPDGTRVVTASNDRTARTYDIRPRSKRKYIGQTKPLEKSGEEKIKLEENEIEVKTESYGKEFLVKRFFTPEVDKDAKITEEKDANGEVVAKIIDEGSEVWEFVSLPDGKIAYIKGKDVKVWDPGTDRVLVLKGCKDPIGRICALPDGRIVTSSSVDCRLMIWNINEEGVEKSTVIETGGILRSDIVAMKALPDGRIAVATEKDITLVTAKDDRIETRSFLPHKTNFTRSIDVTPDGRSLVSTTDLDIYIWDVENIGKDKIKRQQVRIQNGSEIVVKNNMCFLTDGKIVTTYLEKRLSGSEDIHELTARVLDLKEKKMTTWSGSAEYISDIAGISNKGIISVAGDPAGDLKGAIPVRLWDLWKGTATLYDLLDESAMGIIRTSDGRIAMRFDKRIKLNMVPVAGVREEELTDEELDEEAVRQALETDRPTLVFYNVESDYTGFVEKIAEERGAELEEFLVKDYTDEYELIGGFLPKGEASSGLEWQDGLLPRLIREISRSGKETVLLMHTFHNMRPEVAVMLNAFLQDGYLYLPTGETLEKPENLRIIALANEENPIPLSLAEQARWVKVTLKAAELDGLEERIKERVREILKDDFEAEEAEKLTEQIAKFAVVVHTDFPGVQDEKKITRFFMKEAVYLAETIAREIIEKRESFVMPKILKEAAMSIYGVKLTPTGKKAFRESIKNYMLDMFPPEEPREKNFKTEDDTVAKTKYSLKPEELEMREPFTPQVDGGVKITVEKDEEDNVVGGTLEDSLMNRDTKIVELPEGRLAYIIRGPLGALKVWDPNKGRVLALGGRDFSFGNISVLSDGRIVTTDDGPDIWIRIWDIDYDDLDKTTVTTMSSRGGRARAIHNLAILPDDRIAVGLWEDENKRNIQILDVKEDTVESEVLFDVHRFNITNFDVTPDGKIVSYANGSMKIWDIDMSEETAGVQEIRNVPTAYDMTVLDERRIATRIYDQDIGDNSLKENSVKIWDIESKKVTTLRGHKGMTNTIEVLSDGRLVDGGGYSDGKTSEYDPDIRIWDPETGSCQVLEGKDEKVNKIFAISGNRVVSMIEGKKLKLWKVPEGAEAFLEPRPLEKKEGLYIPTKIGIFTETGTTLGFDRRPFGIDTNVGTISDNKDLAKKELLQILMGHEKDVIGIAELPDGRIVTAGKDRKIKIWNLKTKSVSEIQPPKGRNIPISSFAVLPDGRIVAGSEDGSVSVWNLEGVPYVRIFRMFSSVGAVTAITVLPGDKIAAAGIVGGYRAIKILDLTKQKENIVTLMPGDGKVKVINIIGNIKSLAVLKNGNIAMCDESDDGVKVFDRESKQIYVLKAQGKLKSGKVRMIKVLSDGRLVSAAARGMIKIWEADGLKVTQISLPTVTSISELEEDKLVCGDSRGSVDILDLKHEIAFTIDAHTIDTDLVNSVNSVCKVSGNKFATACRDGSAKVWQIPKQKPFRKKEEVTRDNKEKTGHFTENPFTIRGNEFDIVLSEAKTSKVLDNTDSKEALLHDLIGHETKVWGISELPDGRIVTASEDHKIKIWNLKTKEVIEVQDLTDSAPFRSLAVLSDGRIVTGSEHGKVEVWDLESKKVRKLGVFGDSPVTAITVLSGSRVYASGKSEGRSVIAMIDLDEVDENVSVLTPGEGTGNDGNITGDIRSIAILVNNNIAICDGSKDGVKIFNIRDHGIWTLKGERSFEFGYIWSMKALSGGRLAVGEAGQVDIWDMGAEEFTHVYLPKLEDGKNGIIISISELEKDKLVCGDHSGHVHVLDLKTKTELTMIPYTSDGSSVNPVSVEKISDSRFATLHRDGPPRIWQVPKPKIDGPGKPAEPVKAEKTKKGKIFYENGSLNVDGVTYPVVNEDLVEKDEEKLLVDVDPLVEVERSMLLAWKNRKTATLIGPPGVGKTEMAADLAKRAGLPSYIFPMRKGIDLTDWLGKYYQDEYGNFVITSRPYKGKDGKLHYREHLLEFMAHGGVFIVDEGALGKDAERMLQWLALIAQGKRKIKITEHPSSEPVEIELSEHFHVVITTNPIGKTALRRPIPLEVLANSQVINVSGDFSKDDLIRILYPIIEKSEALKELYRDSERGLDYYIRKICENLIEDHWDIKMLIGKEIATGVESLKQDRYFISLRELKNYAKDYVRFYPHIKGKRLGCPEITSYTVGHMINYAFMFGKEDRETIKMRRNIHAAYEEAILDSEIEEHDEYIELAGVRIKKGRIMDEFHRVREEDIDWGESIETEEHALRALLLSMATERPVMMLNEAGSRDRVILEKLAAKMNYEMHVNACSPDQSVVDILGGLFPRLRGETDGGRILMQKDGFLTRQLKSDTEGSKIIYLKNIDALDEDVRAALSNFLLKGYLDVKDESGEWVRLDVPNNIRIVASVSVESNADFSSAFYNRFNRVRIEPARYRPTITDNRIYAASMRQILLKMPDISGVRTRELREVASYAEDKIGDKEALDRILGALSRLTPRARKNLAELITLLMTGMHGDKLKTDIHMRALREHDGSLENRSLEKFFQLAWEAADKRASVTIPELVSMLMRFYGLPQKAAMRIRGIYEKIKRFDEQARWPSHKRYNFSIKEALLLGAYVRNAIITKKARGEEVDIYRIISEEAYTLYGEALEGESDGLGLSDKLYFNLYVLNLEQEHDNVIEADPVVTLDKDGFIADVAGVPVSPNKKKAVTPENVDSTYRLLYVPTIVRTMRAILRAWQPSQVPSGRSLPRAVSLMGQTGVAKTTLGVNLSYVLGLDHYVFPTHRQARETDLTMDIGIGGGEYYKDIKEFLNTVRRGNCVLVVDEANIRSKLLYGIISELAAGKKQFTVEFPGAEEEKVEVGENTFVMLTMNPQKEYGGRQKLPPVVMEDVVKIWVGGNYTEDEIALITRSFLGIYEKELSNLKINTDFLQAPTPGGRVMLTPSVLSPGQFALMRETEDRLYRKDGIGKQLKAALQSPVVQRRLKLVQDGIMALTHVELDRIGVSAKWSFAIYPDGSKEVTIGIKDLAKEVPPEEEMDHIKSMIGVIIHEIRHQKFSLLSRELAEAIDSGKVKFDEQAKENLKKALKSRAYHTFFNALEDGRIDSIKLDILAGENDYLKIWADREFRGQMTDKEIQTAEKLAEFQPHLAFENELFHYIYTKRFSEAFRQYPEELQKALHRSKKWALKATKKGWWGSMSVLPTSAEDREEVIVCQLRAMKIIAERILPEFDRFVKESVENIADKIRNKKMKISIVPPGGKKGKGEQGGEDQQGEGAPTAGEGAEGAGEGEGEGEGEGMGGEGEGIPIDFDLLPEDVKKELMEQMKNSVAGKMNPIGHEPESGDEVPGMPGEPGEGESVPGEAVPGEGVPGEGEPEGKPTSEEGQEGVFAAGEGEEGQEGEGKPAAAEGEETEEGEGTEGKPAGKTGEEGEEAREGEPEQGEGRQPVQPLMPEEGQMTPEEAAQEMKAQDKNAEESLGKRLNDIRENQPFVYNLSKVDPIVMMMSEGIKDALLEEGEDDFVYSASGRGDEVDFRRYLQGHPKPFRRRIESETIRKTSFEMCIDLSGSMDERNNPGLKEAVLAAAALFMSTMNPLEEELDEVEYGLSGFHGKFVPFKNFGQTLASGDLNGVMSALNSFYATGNVTDITHAVKQIIERLKDQEGLKIACMITDGEDNQYIRRGKGGKMEATGILADALREAEENGIIIVGIGIGEAARNCVEIFTHHAKIMSFDEIPELFIKIIEGQTLSDGLPVGDLIRQFGIRPDRSRRKEFMQRVEAQARKTATERHERTERDPGSVSHQEPEDEPFRSERTSLDDSYPEFLERRSENTEEQDPRVPVDVDNVLELLKNIIPAHLEDGRVYTIRYDTARLTSGQVEVIDEYVKCLKVRASNPRNIRVHPYSSRVGDKRSLIMVSCKGKGFFGEGRIDVKEEQAKELEKYILRIPLMLNIAIASSNIPDVESREELESYRRIIDYVQSQVKIITGGVLPLAGSHEEMLHALRNVTLTLPDADKVDHKYLIDRYNTQIREVLLAV